MLPVPNDRDTRAYILLPGIRTKPNDNRNWAPEMASDINLLPKAKGDEFRYFASALFHNVGIEDHAGFVVDLAYRYFKAGYSPVLVGHSNGCEIIRRAINRGPAIFKALHLIAGACDADFQANGLKAALTAGRVEKIHVYVSKGDGVLNNLARNSKRLFSWLGGSYGTLGFDGPQNVDSFIADGRVTVERRESFSHGQWFEGVNWEETRRLITRLES